MLGKIDEFRIYIGISRLLVCVGQFLAKSLHLAIQLGLCRTRNANHRGGDLEEGSHVGLHQDSSVRSETCKACQAGLAQVSVR